MGYSLFVDWEAPEKRGVMWHKFTMAERVIAAGQHDWIWWIDFDTLFTNFTFPAHEQIHRILRQLPPERADEIDALLSPDCFELNAGSMIYRSRPSTVDFFNQVRAWHDGHWDNNEQDCVREATKLASNKTWERYAELHRDPPPFARDAPFKVTDYGSMHEHKQVLMTHQSDINPFPDEIKCHERDEETWRQGMIIVHFAGAWAHMKDDKDATGTLMKKYSALVSGR
jgi:mannan polymerase II complex MNN10 subunit